MTPFVYFMRETKGGGPVKIGTSYDPRDRLEQLASWSPSPLEIVATVPGGQRLEGRFHSLFAHLLSHREWFHPDPAIDAVIAAIVAGTFDPAALPDGPSVILSLRAKRSHAARGHKTVAA